MKYFPFYMNITGRTFLVIGGGPVAREKIDRLRRFTDDIIVIAPETEIKESGAAGSIDTVERTGISGNAGAPGHACNGLRVLRREYREEDLSLGDYVVAATGIREVDRKVVLDCRRRRIPVNVVDDQEYCDFIFPSIIKKGDLTVAISTAGTSPAYAKQLRQEIEEFLPQNIEGILARMGDIRSEVAVLIPDQKKRAAAYKELLAALLASENASTEEEITAIIAEYTKK